MPSGKAELLADPRAVGTALAAICMDEYGLDWLEYEPETLGDELGRLAGKQLPQTNCDKLQALTLLFTRDLFWKDIRAFTHTANALGGTDLPVLFTAFDPPDPEECAWVVYEAFLNEPLDTGEQPVDRFSRDVLYYVGSILQDAGLLSAPAPIDFVPLPNAELSIFADEPVIYETLWQVQDNHRRAISTYVEERTKLLLQQLSSLSLKNGSAEELLRLFQAA